MKKYIFIILATFLVLVTAANVSAVEWAVANQATIGWNAVTNMIDGEPVPVGDTVTYNLYLKKNGVSGDGDFIAETGALEYTITFPSEGRWVVGVQAVRKPQENPEDIKTSVITWSYLADAALVPVPFGFIYYQSPANVSGFGPKAPN